MKEQLIVEKISEEQWPEWDTLVENSPNGTIFDLTSWNTIYAKAFSLPYEIHGCWCGKELVGGIVLYYDIIRGMKCGIKPPFIPYNSVIIKDFSYLRYHKRLSLGNTIHNKISQYLIQKFAHVDFYTHYTVRDIRPFIWNSWSQEVKYTFVVALGESERNWRRVDPKTRNMISKALRQGITLITGDEVRDFLLLQQKSPYFLHYAQYFRMETFGNFYHALKKQGLCTLYFARNNRGEALSAVLLLQDKRRIYYFMGANDKSRNDGANELILWKIIEECRQGTWCEFDLGGANMEKIAHFKLGFGGDLVPYYRLQRINTSAMRRYLYKRRLWQWCRSIFS